MLDPVPRLSTYKMTSRYAEFNSFLDRENPLQIHNCDDIYIMLNITSLYVLQTTNSPPGRRPRVEIDQNTS